MFGEFNKTENLETQFKKKIDIIKTENLETNKVKTYVTNLNQNLRTDIKDELQRSTISKFLKNALKLIKENQYVTLEWHKEAMQVSVKVMEHDDGHSDDENDCQHTECNNRTIYSNTIRKKIKDKLGLSCAKLNSA